MRTRRTHHCAWRGVLVRAQLDVFPQSAVARKSEEQRDRTDIPICVATLGAFLDDHFTDFGSFGDLFEVRSLGGVWEHFWPICSPLGPLLGAMFPHASILVDLCQVRREILLPKWALWDNKCYTFGHALPFYVQVVF